MENQPVYEKSMANLLEIHGIRGKNKRIHGIFTDGVDSDIAKTAFTTVTQCPAGRFRHGLNRLHHCNTVPGR